MGETIKFIDINGENHPIDADLLDGLHSSSFALVTDLANYYTKSQTYSQSEIEELIGAITEFDAVVTTELPTASESTMKKIYLIPSAGEGQNSKDEYITWLDGDVYKWEKIGSTGISLDGYATEDYVDEEIEYLATQKQDTLISGENIKTINGDNILGNGNLSSTMDPNGIRYREYDNWPYSFQPLYAYNCSTEILDFEYVPESSNVMNISASIETGRVEQGSRSEQKFSERDIKFEYFPFKRETMVILPNSRKQISANETRRRYCTRCGKKASPKDKFCSNCGTKLK